MNKETVFLAYAVLLSAWGFITLGILYTGISLDGHSHIAAGNSFLLFPFSLVQIPVIIAVLYYRKKQEERLLLVEKN